MIKEKTNEKIQKLLIESVNLQKSGRLDELEKVLREITNIDSNYHPALFNLGRLSEKKKKYIEAIKFYKKTLKSALSSYLVLSELTTSDTLIL